MLETLFEPSNDDNLGSRLFPLEHLFDKADALIEEGTNILILSDRGVCKINRHSCPSCLCELASSPYSKGTERKFPYY